MSVNQPLLDALADVFKMHVSLPPMERNLALEKPVFPAKPLLHKNTLYCLSGLDESVTHDGDVFVLGDVASGIQINAGGSVTVAKIEKGNLVFGEVNSRVKINAGEDIQLHGAGSESKLKAGRSIFAFPGTIGSMPAPYGHHMMEEFAHQSRLGGFGNKVVAKAEEHIRISAEGEKCSYNGRWVVTGFNRPHDSVKLSPKPAVA